MHLDSYGTSCAVLGNREAGGGRLSLSLASHLWDTSRPAHDLFDR